MHSKHFFLSRLGALIRAGKLFFCCATATLLLCATPLALHAAEIPKVGDKAPDFALKTLDDQTVRLGELTAKGSVVLVVLRGWPG